MRIRIKTRVVFAYLIAACCVTVFFGVYLLSVPQLPPSRSRNGIERAARDSWSEVRHHERNSPLQVKRELHKLGFLSFLHKKDEEKNKPTGKDDVPKEQAVQSVGATQIVIPPTAVLSNMSREALSNLYHRYTQQVQIKCSSVERLGKVTDGGWEVCEDDRYKPSAPCLVYSFGVGDDFSFDDAVAKRYGCEVHSFDPSMKSTDYQRPSSVHFHALGLANYSGVTSSGWKMSSLTDIQTSLGHSQKELAVLKLDIEEWEWTVLPSLVKGSQLRQTTQLLVELHQCQGCSQYNPDQVDKEPPRGRYQLALGILGDLYDLGFRIFWQHQNKACRYISRFGLVERNACCELHLVRTAGTH